MSIIPLLNAATLLLNAATLANLTTQTALRVTTMNAKGGGTPPGKFAADVDIGPWEGVQCCPSCLEPISEKEKWSACCSKCGYTETIFILTKTRARRKVITPDGVETWEWKPVVGSKDHAPTVIVLLILAVGLFTTVTWLALS